MFLNDSQNIKRAGIYVFFDKDGIVDNYVYKLLDSLYDVCCHLTVVINGNLNECGKIKLKEHADNLIIRENKGYDITAYMCGLNYLKEKYYNEFDEVVLLNSTLYGPFFPLEKMFGEMAKRDLDFWGLIKHYATYDTSIASSKYNYIPEHIQSYFIVLRRSLLYSDCLDEYFKNLPKIENYNDARGKFEIEFTKDISDKGYKYDVYMDMSKYKEYSSNFIMWLPYELVLNGCTFLKQKSFNFGSEVMLSTTQTQKAFDFIKENTDYDTNLIIDNILRTQNIADIKNMMQLSFCLPSECILENATEVNLKTASLVDGRLCTPNFNSLKDTDIFLIIDEKTVLADFDNKLVKVIQSNKSIENVLLENLNYFTQAYDLLCVVPNIQEENFKPYYDGLFYKNIVLENIAASRNYIKNVISRFYHMPKLGLLVSPPYYCGQHEAILPNGWDGCFNKVKEAAKTCGINVNIDSQKPPIIAYNSALWVRPKALVPLINYETQDQLSHKAIERLYAFSAQNEGYFSGYVLSSQNAAQMLTSLEYFANRYGALQNNFLKYKRKLKKILPAKLIGKLLNIKGK